MGDSGQRVSRVPPQLLGGRGQASGVVMRLRVICNELKGDGVLAAVHCKVMRVLGGVDRASCQYNGEGETGN